jgi:hypothetical protein
VLLDDEPDVEPAEDESESMAGPFVLPGAPLTPGPELCGELGFISDESASIAGAAARSAAIAEAARMLV